MSAIHFLRRVGERLALLTVTLLVCLAIFELVVFRYILVPDDLLENVSIGGVVRYMPDTRAVFRHPDGSRSLVTINREGWNSTKPYYVKAKSPGTLRVAVVGDSYVHGAFVNVDKSFAHVVEQRLKASGYRAQVYRFGMDGAPLSQYLHMLRKTVVAYKPDVVVVPLIHNDFDESFRFLKTRYTSSFMKLRLAKDGSVVELPPHDFQPGPADIARNFNTFRYMYYETGLYLRLKSLVSRYVWGGNEEWRPEFISSAVDVRNLKDTASIRRATRYIFTKMKALAERHNFKLILVMDGVREAVYAGRDPAGDPVGKLNIIAAEEARTLGLAFHDLHADFVRHYAKHGQRFEFSFDWHWNELGNELVGRAITREIMKRVAPETAGRGRLAAATHTK